MQVAGSGARLEGLLQAITEANVHFVDGRDKNFLFPKFLQHCVDVTESGFGFIGELIDSPSAPHVLHIISFNSHATIHLTTATTLELTTHLTDAITSRAPSIINDFPPDALPPTFPPIHSLLGIPLFHHDDLIGMIGLADKSDGGYESSLVSFLRPFSNTCSTLMVGYRKAAEQQSMLHKLENARREAEESALAKANFLSNMSHEIRTPLNGIIGLTSLVLDSPLTFDQREMIETVQSSGDLLLSVVNDILDLAKFEAGKLDLHEIHFDIRACVEACIDVIAIGAERKGIEVLSDVSHSVPATMLGDFDRVRQILTNLVGNAVKFTERGEVVVGVRIESAKIMVLQRSFSGELVPNAPESESDDGPKVVHFWVRDTGIGIPRDKKDLLFKMYTQIDPYRTNGTGLGLAICKRLVEAMSGRIWATSEQGSGSCFHFVLPARTNTDTIPYYPPIKGKSVAIFSHFESHARVLQDFAYQHAMSATTQILAPNEHLLTPAQLQSLNSSSAVIIDVVYADRIVAQLERYFREGRASPVTPTYTPSPPHALDVRGLWAGSSLTTAANFTQPNPGTLLPLPPLMLPKATLRLAQVHSFSPVIQPEQEVSTPPPTSLPPPFGLIPPPIATSTSSSDTATVATMDPLTGVTTSTSIYSASTTITSSTTSPSMPTQQIASPTHTATPVTPSRLKKPAGGKPSSPRGHSQHSRPSQEPPSASSKVMGRRRSRTYTQPIYPLAHSPKQRRNTSPTKGKYLAMFNTAIQTMQTDPNVATSPTDKPSLIPSPRETQGAKPAKPTALAAKLPPTSEPKNIPTRSTSVPKSMPPISETTESTTPPKPVRGMQQSKSAYAIAYINATQATMSTTPPERDPLSPKRPPSLKLNTQKVASPPPSANSSPRLAANPTNLPSISPKLSPVTSPSVPVTPPLTHPSLKIITNTNSNTGSASSSNSNSNSNTSSTTSTTPLQSPIAIGGLVSSSSNSSYGSTNSNSPGVTPPSSVPSTPSHSPTPSIACPVLIFVPLSSPAPRTSCANLYFLPKPIRFSRLSRKLEAIFETPQSPSTPSRIDRPPRRSSGSRLAAGEDYPLDHSMAMMHPLSIMVGEDNLVGQVVTQRMLNKLGYSAEFYANGDTLLAGLENRIFDVILLDLKMPGSDGFECARRICEALPVGHRPHIAAVTANILQSDREMAAEVGFNDYITKPFLLADLAKVLAHCKKLDPEHTHTFKRVSPS